MSTVDTSKRYFFHNVYGDAADLLAALPDDVVDVPFGWDDAAEQRRNEILAAIGHSVSGLPSLLYYSNGAWCEFRWPHDGSVWTWEQVI